MRFCLNVLLLFALLPTHGVVLAQQQAGSDWSRVQQLDAGTSLRISAQRRPTICSFLTADESTLTCTQTHNVFFVPVRQKLLFNRQEISAIKLSRQAISTLAGAAIGAGAGAGIGAGVDASSKSNEDGHLATALFTIFGGGIGTAVGSHLDFLAGPIIYRAP